MSISSVTSSPPTTITAPFSYSVEKDRLGYEVIVVTTIDKHRYWLSTINGYRVTLKQLDAYFYHADSIPRLKWVPFTLVTHDYDHFIHTEAILATFDKPKAKEAEKKETEKKEE